MQHLQAIDKTVDSLHEVVQEYDVAEAEAKEPEFGWESWQLGEVVELVGLWEIQKEVSQAGTSFGQLLQN